MPQSISRQLVNLLQTIFAIFNDFIELALLETKLATKTIFILLGLVLFSFILFTAIWVCLMLIIFLALVALGLKNILALCFITLFNLLLIIPVIFIAKKLQANLSFQVTRKQITTLAGKTNETA